MSDFDGALAADRAVRQALKERDRAISAVCKDKLGIEVPQIIEYTDPESGNIYSINVTARIALVERGIAMRYLSTEEETE